MITQINNASDAMKALSENFHELVTKKRDLKMAKEVTNNIGKMVNLAKVQVVEKLRVGDKTPLMWLWVDEQKPLPPITQSTLIEEPSKTKKPVEFHRPLDIINS